MSESFDLPEADWVLIGVVGEPGRRTFYLQAGQGSTAVTLKVEKAQVGALAGFIADMLADLPEEAGTDAGASVGGDLREPVEPAWTVGAIQLRYDNVADRVIVHAEEVVAELEGEVPSDDTGTARIGLSRSQARSFVEVGSALVSSGRAICPLCGRPMNLEGHSCPRTNGHHSA